MTASQPLWGGQTPGPEVASLPRLLLVGPTEEPPHVLVGRCLGVSCLALSDVTLSDLQSRVPVKFLNDKLKGWTPFPCCKYWFRARAIPLQYQYQPNSPLPTATIPVIRSRSRSRTHRYSCQRIVSAGHHHRCAVIRRPALPRRTVSLPSPRRASGGWRRETGRQLARGPVSTAVAT